MTALEKIKQVYGLCTKLEDKEWLEDGFFKLEHEEPRELTRVDKMIQDTLS